MVCSANLSHVSVGGCSDSNQIVSCMARTGALFEPPAHPTVIPGCVRTVASDTVDSGRPASAPALRRLPTCKLWKLGESLHHGGGVHPARQGHPIFLLPSALSPGGWCRRRLTLAETWGAFNVPHRVAALLKDQPGWKAWNDCRTLLPGRCMEHGTHQLLAGMSAKIEGGGVLLADENATQLKAAKADDARVRVEEWNSTSSQKQWEKAKH